MIHFVVAFDAEARPLIDHFNLKRMHHERSFPIYQAGHYALVVSGAGKIAAAAATAHLHGITGFRQQQVWINFGIAGHPSLPLGTACLCHRIIESRTQKTHYPQLVTTSPWPTESLYTNDEPDTGYTQDGLVDMEASSFFSSANRYTTAELIQAIKVVSDNPQNPLDGIPAKQQIIDLLAAHVEPLESYCNSLQALSDQLQPDTRIAAAAGHYQQQLHFSFSQYESLQHLLQQWLALDHDCTLDALCNIKAGSSKELLKRLKQEISSAGATA